MSLLQYNAWLGAGSPWSETGPLQQVLAKLRAAYPSMVYGTLGDQAHLLASPPEDHTPYSATGWPLSNPYPVVHALDVMEGNGVSCQALFDYWLPEAKAGRMPWLKYMIWQAKLYSVRSTPAWTPQSNSDHFDHIHLSARTDTEAYQLGTWSPVPGSPSTGVDTMNFFADSAGTQYVADANFYQYWAFNDVNLWRAVRAAAGNPPANTVATSYITGGAFGEYQGLYTLPRKAPASSGDGGLTAAQVATIADARISQSSVVPQTP